jgi:putative DNA primase/helicase
MTGTIQGNSPTMPASDGLLRAAAPTSVCAGEARADERRIRAVQFPYTDSGNAERLISKHGKDFYYLHDRGKWLHWDGKRWNNDETAEIHRAAKTTARTMHEEAALIEDDERRRVFSKWVTHSESRSALENMVVLAQKESGIAALSSQFDNDPLLLNVINGTLDLRTGALRQHRREDHITKLCPIEFDPTATCLRWLAFLNEVLPDQAEVIAFVQRSLGYSLTGSIDEQCFWLLIGVGKNGKSKFLDAIQFLLGDYAIATTFDTFAKRKKGTGAISPRDGLACLAGSRFVRASESDRQTELSEALIKSLTGGERVRTARMYQQDFDYLPEYKIWLSTNHPPIIRGGDEGIWRRIHRINFDYVVPENKRDLQLGTTLQQEAAGILNWALAGLKEYQARGLAVPNQVKRATRGYRKHQSSVGRFLEDCTAADDGGRIAGRELYGRYKTWAVTNDDGVMTLTAFGTEAKKWLNSKQGKTGVSYLGIRFRRDEMDQETVVPPTVENFFSNAAAMSSATDPPPSVTPCGRGS